MHTFASLTPHLLETFAQVRAALPPAIAERLRCSRRMAPHGSYATLGCFDVWDTSQNDMISKQHFKYCLGHDHRPQATRVGYLHLWLNKTRIYRERDSIVSTLERELRRSVPPGFTYHPQDRAFDIKWEFDYPRRAEDLPGLLVPRYLALIQQVHPLLIPLIESVSAPVAPGERRAAVAARGRIAPSPPGPRHIGACRDFSRSIPPKWRPLILAKTQGHCACCGQALADTWHADHIHPFSQGGLTTLDNLQPLCPSCNLRKGGR